MPRLLCVAVWVFDLCTIAEVRHADMWKWTSRCVLRLIAEPGLALLLCE
ncbi:MAG: hypothetical protein ACK4SY_08925 [Pyrobaculum sp.]